MLKINSYVAQISMKELKSLQTKYGELKAICGIQYFPEVTYYSNGISLNSTITINYKFIKILLEHLNIDSDVFLVEYFSFESSTIDHLTPLIAKFNTEYYAIAPLILGDSKKDW